MSTMKSIASRHNGYDSYVSIAGNVTIDQAIMMRFLCIGFHFRAVHLTLNK
jgi:hypothetical protein